MNIPSLKFLQGRGNCDAWKSREGFFRNFNIEEPQKSELENDFRTTGWFQIPVDRFLDYQPLDYFKEKVDIYYNTLPELIKLLELDHLPKLQF